MFRVLLIRSLVSIRDNDVIKSKGFLALLEHQEDASIQLAFIPEDKLTKKTLSQYNNLCTRSRQALWKHTTLDLDEYTLVELPECISTDLTFIYFITLENILTLSSRGDSCCLVQMKLFLKSSTAPESHILLISVVFETNSYGKSPTLQQVEQELTNWFAILHKRLELYPQVMHGFVIQDMTVDQINALKSNNPLPGITLEKRWTAQTENQFVHMATNFANFGFSIASAIVGKPNTNSIVDRAEGVAWGVIDTLSKVTEFSRGTTANALEHPLSRPFLQFIPLSIRNVFLSNGEVEALLSEYDSAGHYLRQWGRDMVRRPSRITKTDGIDTSKEYSMLKRDLRPVKGMAPLGMEEFLVLKNMNDKESIRSRIFCHGVSPIARHCVWKYLFRDALSSEDEIEKVEQFYSIKSSWQTILYDATLNPDVVIPDEPPSPVDQSSRSAPGDERDGGSVISKIKDRKYRIEKDVVRTDRNVDFFEGLPSDQVIPPLSDDNTSAISTAPPLSVNLAMLRDILITYTIYDYDLGYVQGMNDLLAPLLFVFGTNDISTAEPESFWCFVSLMTRMKHNFKKDQSGMRNKLRLLELLIKYMDPFLYAHLESTDSLNLFCCFRWLLVSFKREFSFDDILRLWEAIWSCPLTSQFDIVFAFAILNKYRNHIMTKCTAFDETLRFINDLSGNIDVLDILKRAEVLFRVFQESIAKDLEERLEIKLEKKYVTLIDADVDESGDDEFEFVWNEGSDELVATSITEQLSDEELMELMTLF